MDSFTRRKPEFVTVPLLSVNAKALSDISSIRGLNEDNPIPVEYTEDSVDMIKVHCDWLKEENYSVFRQTCLNETGFPGEFLYKNKHSFPPLPLVSCKHNHNPSNCKCHLILFHSGQDEAVYRQFAISSKEWTVDGAGKMRKKNENDSKEFETRKKLRRKIKKI